MQRIPFINLISILFFACLEAMLDISLLCGNGDPSNGTNIPSGPPLMPSKCTSCKTKCMLYIIGFNKLHFSFSSVILMKTISFLNTTSIFTKNSFHLTNFYLVLCLNRSRIVEKNSLLKSKTYEHNHALKS